MGGLPLPAFTRGTTGSSTEKGYRATGTTLRQLTSTAAVATTTTTVADVESARATTGTRDSPAACRGRPRIASGSGRHRDTAAVGTGAPNTGVVVALFTTPTSLLATWLQATLLAMAPATRLASLPQATLLVTMQARGLSCCLPSPRNPAARGRLSAEPGGAAGNGRHTGGSTGARARRQGTPRRAPNHRHRAFDASRRTSSVQTVATISHHQAHPRFVLLRVLTMISRFRALFPLPGSRTPQLRKQRSAGSFHRAPHLRSR